jgi:sec-independent protein translocase protein TatA
LDDSATGEAAFAPVAYYQGAVMGSFSIWHLLIVLVVVVVIFGAGRLPSAMNDLAKGIKAFRSGMKDEPQEAQRSATPAPGSPQVTADAAKPAAGSTQATHSHQS